MSVNLEEIKRWINKGDHDLGTAIITYQHIPEYVDTITFHCQQAIEKYLKAYLIFHSTTFKFSHDLVYLLDIIVQKDPEMDTYYDELSKLQGYAVEIRYPNEIIFLSKEVVEKAILLAKEIRTGLTNRMQIVVDYNKILDL